ncbi:retrovirus-related pol polyprotein from transposon RE1 [Tanacetum coccineum]
MVSNKHPAWYTELKNFLLACGFRKSQVDASLLIYDLNGITSYFLVYVDDIVLIGNNTQFLDEFLNKLGIKFSIKDLVNKLSHFMHAPTQLYLQASRRVLRYLKGTIHHGLFLNRKSPITLTSLSLIQIRVNYVSGSSTEMEYKALANASARMTWVKFHLLIRESVYHSRMKHVALDYQYFVRERVSEGSLRALHISSN